MDWKSLTFSYTKTNTMLCTYFRNGAWTPVESRTDDTIALSAFAGALHYSIECFEGLKAFRGKDGKVRLFRPEENAMRLRRLGVRCVATHYDRELGVLLDNLKIGRAHV